MVICITKMNISRIFRRLPLNLLCFDSFISINSNILLQNNVKRYSRWTHRRPSKVFYPENENSFDENINVEKKNLKAEHNTDKQKLKSFSKPKNKFKENAKQISEEEENMSDDEDTIQENNSQEGTSYTKLSNTDSTLSQLMLKVKSRKTREKNGIIMLEGKRLNQDAILAGHIPQQIFFTRKDDIEDLLMPAGVVRLFKVTYKVMQLWSSVQTAPGLIGFYKIPQMGKVKEDSHSIPLTIICDNIRDPGNVGSILRTAAGVGCSKVLLVKGCADVWDSKVLRAASGGHFRVPLEQDVDWDDVNHYLDVNTSVLLADNRVNIKNDDAMSSYLPLVPYHSVNYSAFSSVAVVIGGECDGLSRQAVLLSRYQNGVRLNIPLANELDSLNSASALSVISFEIKRQLTSPHSEEVSYKQ